MFYVLSLTYLIKTVTCFESLDLSGAYSLTNSRKNTRLFEIENQLKCKELLNCSNIINLNISNNNFGRVPITRPFRNILYMSLVNCNIKKFDRRTKFPRKLRSLDLSNNPLVSLSYHPFSRLSVNLLSLRKVLSNRDDNGYKPRKVYHELLDDITLLSLNYYNNLRNSNKKRELIIDLKFNGINKIWPSLEYSIERVRKTNFKLEYLVDKETFKSNINSSKYYNNKNIQFSVDEYDNCSTDTNVKLKIDHFEPVDGMVVLRCKVSGCLATDPEIWTQIQHKNEYRNKLVCNFEYNISMLKSDRLKLTRGEKMVSLYCKIPMKDIKDDDCFACHHIYPLSTTICTSYLDKKQTNSDILFLSGAGFLTILSTIIFIIFFCDKTGRQKLRNQLAIFSNVIKNDKSIKIIKSNKTSVNLAINSSSSGDSCLDFKQTIYNDITVYKH